MYLTFVKTAISYKPLVFSTFVYQASLTAKSSKKVWQIQTRPVTFAPVLYNLLIKKGRGIWPDEALATNNVKIEKVLIPATPAAWKDKSDSSFQPSINNIESSSDLQVSFFVFIRSCIDYTSSLF